MSKELISILICDGLLTVLLLLFYKFPPKEINALYGYRTKRSFKSQTHWDYAQRFVSKYWLIVPLQIIITHLILYAIGVPFDKSPPIYFTFFMAEFVISTAVLIYTTEVRLKNLDKEQQDRKQN